jgi:hypothetical protein
MDRPHAAREDFALFSVFRRLVTPNEYDSLGEWFESQQHQLFSEDVFEKVVDEVTSLEKMGLEHLAQFTPA